MMPKYKDIVDLIKKGSTLEAQEKIMELRETAVQRQDENYELREKIKALQDKLEIKGNLVWEKPYYWLKNGVNKEGPYCQLCWDKETKLIRLQDGVNGVWNCHSCESYFTDRSHVAPTVEVSHGRGSWMSR